MTNTMNSNNPPTTHTHTHHIWEHSDCSNQLTEMKLQAAASSSSLIKHDAWTMTELPAKERESSSQIEKITAKKKKTPAKQADRAWHDDNNKNYKRWATFQTMKTTVSALLTGTQKKWHTQPSFLTRFFQCQQVFVPYPGAMSAIYHRRLRASKKIRYVELLSDTGLEQLQLSHAYQKRDQASV